ncbi:hypothetical protein ACDL92_04270 [Ihubacter sp. mB4P-1]|uniref:hypothetical protein n=1 Tax=Ihubacter sp. mB4P-1 TaxID=3242370 RepID=UPI003C79F083
MTDTIAILALLLIPLLTSVIKTDQRGLLTGFFISLYYLSQAQPALTLIPLMASAAVFYIHRPAAESLSTCVFIKNPAMSFFIVFFITMLTFCAFSSVIFQYGYYLHPTAAVLERSKQLSSLAVLAAPLLFGRLIDKKGPFFAAILLSLAGELSVLFISAADHAIALFFPGSFLLSATVAGFFVVMPLVSAAFFGSQQFFLSYPFLLPPAVLLYGFVSYLSKRSSISHAPGEFTVTLLLLSCLSALFLFLGWKRRMVLITNKRIS